GRGHNWLVGPESSERSGDVAGVRGVAARAVSTGNAGAKRCLADDRGVWIPGIRVGGGRSARSPHRPWRSPDGRGPEGVVKVLALGVDHRSAPAKVRETLAFDDRRCPE